VGIGWELGGHHVEIRWKEVGIRDESFTPRHPANGHHRNAIQFAKERREAGALIRRRAPPSSPREAPPCPAARRWNEIANSPRNLHEIICFSSLSVSAPAARRATLDYEQWESLNLFTSVARSSIPCRAACFGRVGDAGSTPLIESEKFFAAGIVFLAFLSPRSASRAPLTMARCPCYKKIQTDQRPAYSRPPTRTA